jgi:hypothetical protein
MEAVTNAENILRGESVPAQNARKPRCPKGHEYVVRADGTRHCPTCRLARRIDRGECNGRGRPADRTRCVRGHEFTPENTRIITKPDGSFKQRQCKTCCRESTRRRRARARGG